MASDARPQVRAHTRVHVRCHSLLTLWRWVLMSVGWRSWNVYGPHVDQKKMEASAAAIANRSRPGGASILDLGFEYCSLDDFWQSCYLENQTSLGGVQGSFHDASGYPVVNVTKFPSLKNMVGFAHSLGLKMGWYANNCGCEEHQDVRSWGAPASPSDPFERTDGIDHYRGDVKVSLSASNTHFPPQPSARE